MKNRIALMQPKNKYPHPKKRRMILLCFTIPLLALIIFTVWYYQPYHYSGTHIFDLEEYNLDIPADATPLSNHSFNQESTDAKKQNQATVEIRFELTLQKSFFQPDQVNGTLYIDGQEYISTFYAESKDEKPWPYNYPRMLSSSLEVSAIYFPHDTGNWFQNLKAKLSGEEWMPFFVLKGQESTENAVFIYDLQKLFGGDGTEKAGLTVQIGKHIYRENSRMPERYLYPTSFSSCVISERIKECRIPEEQLSEMTTEELVWAVIDFPFLIDVMTGATRNWDYAITCLMEKSDALTELTTRTRPEDTIIKILQKELEDKEHSAMATLAQQVFYYAQDKYFFFTKQQMKFLKTVFAAN